MKNEAREVYVFDLDGTLVDSMPYFTRGILSIPDEEGIPYGDELIKILTPLGYTKSAEYYVNVLGMRDSVEHIVERITEKLVFEYSNNIVLKPGVGDYLRRLHASGARLFVLTASPHVVTDVCLQHNGVFDLFERVWSVEDFGLSKSDTRIFLEVARQIGCQPHEIHYFDDSLIALENATAAGLDTYGVRDSHSPDELTRMRTLSLHFVNSFAEM